MATRKITNKLLEMIEEGILDPEYVAEACLKYMSEDDVADMAHDNEFIVEEEDDDEIAYITPTGKPGRKQVRQSRIPAACASLQDRGYYEIRVSFHPLTPGVDPID